MGVVWDTGSKEGVKMKVYQRIESSITPNTKENKGKERDRHFQGPY